MKTGQQLDILLNYNSLYKLNPQTARMFSTTRKVVQLAIKKHSNGNLADKSHEAFTIHNRTNSLLEEKVIALKNSTKFGYRRVAKNLREKQDLKIKDSTVRNILKRGKSIYLVILD